MIAVFYGTGLHRCACACVCDKQENDGYVCAIARIPLLEIMRGSTMLRFAAPLAPYTTIR
eukprot:scaffold60360_cov23-Tisochrysis_lutea.AAC.4